MSLPKNLKCQYLSRFDELIVEGKLLAESIQKIPAGSRGNRLPSLTVYEFDSQRMARWKTNCLTLLGNFPRQDSILQAHQSLFQSLSGKPHEVRVCIGMLEGYRDDFHKGFLDNLLLRVEAEISADYMGQSEQLLGEGKNGKYDHIPAAVLAGAVLEKALRTLCAAQQPEIAVITQKGERKTLNPLIDDLKAAGVFNELKAKQLRSWADIRNKAAHGEFEQFTKSDVKQMIQGITNFLGDYLT